MSKTINAKPAIVTNIGCLYFCEFCVKKIVTGYSGYLQLIEYSIVIRQFQQ
jgi:hypothetical protein